jgi:uncharacterized protein (DUF1330 family)
MAMVNPDQETFRAFLKTDYDGGPIIGVNFFRYRERANYASDADVEGSTDISGREAYGRYWANTITEAAKVGAKPVLQGRALFSVIVPEGEQWDDVALVQYPSRDAFVEMQKNPIYKAGLKHRDAGLADTRLVMICPGELFE